MAPKPKRYADSVEVRQWAVNLTDADKKSLGIEGIEVSPRGRFHTDLVRAFNRVHRKEGIRYVPIGRNQPRRNDVFEDRDQGDGDSPVVYRQPREPKEVTPLPSAPEPVMELLRRGQNVVVVYVPMPQAV